MSSMSPRSTGVSVDRDVDQLDEIVTNTIYIQKGFLELQINKYMVCINGTYLELQINQIILTGSHFLIFHNATLQKIKLLFQTGYFSLILFDERLLVYNLK